MIVIAAGAKQSNSEPAQYLKGWFNLIVSQLNKYKTLFNDYDKKKFTDQQSLILEILDGLLYTIKEIQAAVCHIPSGKDIGDLKANAEVIKEYIAFEHTPEMEETIFEEIDKFITRFKDFKARY